MSGVCPLADSCAFTSAPFSASATAISGLPDQAA